MRLHGLATLFVIGSILSAPLTAQPRTTLTPHDITEAIQWGERGDPAPYLLHNAQQPGTTNPGVVGVVYTPFVRVALAAKAAQAEGRLLNAEDVPARLVEPVAYIAFRWYCCDHVHGEEPLTFNPYGEPFDYRIAVPNDSVRFPWPRPWRVMTTPLWLTRDLSVLTRFGAGDLPYHDIVLVAGYPMDALVDNTDYIIYRTWPSPNDPRAFAKEVRAARILAADLARWR
jgi:hypothetical protein